MSENKPQSKLESKWQDDPLFESLPPPNFNEADQTEGSQPPSALDAHGLILGLSGMGKSQYVDKVVSNNKFLSFLHQLIHSEALSIPMIWLKFDAPVITGLGKDDSTE